MIVYVFQHKSDIFRLIDVINGVILYFQINFSIVTIDITSNDTRLQHMRFLSCARLQLVADNLKCEMISVPR